MVRLEGRRDIAGGYVEGNDCWLVWLDAGLIKISDGLASGQTLRGRYSPEMMLSKFVAYRRDLNIRRKGCHRKMHTKRIIYHGALDYYHIDNGHYRWCCLPGQYACFFNLACSCTSGCAFLSWLRVVRYTHSLSGVDRCAFQSNSP